MTTTPTGQAEIPESIPEGQVAVASFRRRRAAEEHGLVVLSMKLPYWLYPHAGRFYLCVEAADADAVSEQLDKYRSERKRWSPGGLRLEQFAPTSPWAIGIYVVILCAFYYAQQTTPGLSQAGMMKTASLFNGHQWWRPITALTLHADLGHLAGNLLSGICFGILLSQRFGYGVCWFFLLLSGILGNIVTAWSYFPEPHYSYGASTALFGGLGILVGDAMVDALTRNQPGKWKRSLLPLASGITVLGLTGIGNENTDVLGHVFGFCCGLGLGLALSFALGTKILSKLWQRSFAGLSLLILALAWVFAWKH